MVLIMNVAPTIALDTNYKPGFRICKWISDKAFDVQYSAGKVRCVSIQHLQLLHPTEHVLTPLPDMTLFGGCQWTLEWLCSTSLESEAGGTLEGHFCGRGRSSSVVMIMGCKLFCLSLLFQWCTCYVCACTPMGADLGCYVELGRLDATPFQAALQCVLVALSWLALFSSFLC